MSPPDISGLVKGCLTVITIVASIHKLDALHDWAFREAFRPWTPLNSFSEPIRSATAHKHPHHHRLITKTKTS